MDQAYPDLELVQGILQQSVVGTMEVEPEPALVDDPLEVGLDHTQRPCGIGWKTW
jgi:hypothetical protein